MLITLKKILYKIFVKKRVEKKLNPNENIISHF